MAAHRKPDAECNPRYVKRRAYMLAYMCANGERYNRNARDRRTAQGKAARGPRRGAEPPYDKLDELAMHDPMISTGRI